MRHIPKAYERYRHFKGNCYQILAMAKDSEDASEQVVYQQLYPPFDIYVRPLSMFMSEVDHEKYPSAAQRYRFELISGEEPACKTVTAGESVHENIAAKAAGSIAEQIPESTAAKESDRTAADVPESTAAKASDRTAADVPESAAAEASADAGAKACEAVKTQSGHEQAAEEVDTDAEGKVDENVMAFLDADTYEQKLKIFSAIHDKVTQNMLNTIAVSLDIEVDSGDLEERYRQIQNCLMTFQRYECNRLR